MLNTSVSPGVLVSIDSVRDLNCIPLSSNVVIRSTRFCMLLPRRSSFHTTTMSPSRRRSSMWSSSGRWAFAPEATSVKIRSQPAFRVRPSAGWWSGRWWRSSRIRKSCSPCVRPCHYPSMAWSFGTLITGRVSEHYSSECRGHGDRSAIRSGNLRFREWIEPPTLRKIFQPGAAD